MGIETSVLVGWILTAVVVAAGTYASMKSAQTQSAEKAEESGLKINTRETSEPIKVVYGQQQVGGNDVYFAEQGADNTTLWVVQT